MAATLSNTLPVTEVEIQASQIIERLEEAVEKATEAVTVLEQSDEKDVNSKEIDLGLKGDSWHVNQGFLQPKSKSVPQILSLIEDLIVFENDDTDENESPVVTTLAPLSNIAKYSFVIQSIVSFANTLDRTHLNNLHNKIQNDTTRWITHLFRAFDCTAFFHEEPLEGLIRLTRMLLLYKYPKYLEAGFDCLTGNPPVIYTTTFSSLGIVQHVCRQLGLSLLCIQVVPSISDNFQHKIDVVSFEKMIEGDKASNKIPLLILADAGTPITGYVDNLLKLQDICHQQNMWLHVRGHNLAALALINNNNNVPSKVADSMTLPIGTWLGVPGLPTVTLYKHIQTTENQTVGVPGETTLQLLAGLIVDQLQKHLVALPIWFTLLAFGREEIQSRIRRAFDISLILWKKLSKYTCLRLLSQKPGGDSGTLSIQDVLNRPVTPSNVIFEITSSTVVFQFVPDQTPDAPYMNRVPQYYNKLNSWLGQILQRDIPQINVEICELENAGLVLRICPLEAIIPINNNDIELFINCLEQQLDILSATVRLKSVFQQCVEKNPSLQLVEMEGWAGLGGVRYVPETMDNIETDQCKQDLNKLNIEIVSKLRATDAAFSLGKGDGLVCVRFGMVTADTDVEELLSLVTTIGKDVEESSKYLETMVEIVKKGIETATVDLQKENEERLWQEGILRQVPVFGTLVNWWSPKTKESGIKGRSLNLQAGVVESTENIYRYHMQLQQGASSPPGTKSPPQPLVQTPIVTDSSSRHSRSSSRSSQISQKLTESKNSLQISNNLNNDN